MFSSSWSVVPTHDSRYLLQFGRLDVARSYADVAGDWRVLCVQRPVAFPADVVRGHPERRRARAVGERSPGADVAGLSAVPVQMWHG